MVPRRTIDELLFEAIMPYRVRNLVGTVNALQVALPTWHGFDMRNTVTFIGCFSLMLFNGSQQVTGSCIDCKWPLPPCQTQYRWSVSVSVRRQHVALLVAPPHFTPSTCRPCRRRFRRSGICWF